MRELFDRTHGIREAREKRSYGVSVWMWPMKISRVFTNWYWYRAWCSTDVPTLNIET